MSSNSINNTSSAINNSILFTNLSTIFSTNTSTISSANPSAIFSPNPSAISFTISYANPSTTSSANPSTTSFANPSTSATNSINTPVPITTPAEWNKNTIRLLINQRKYQNAKYYQIIE